jgi:hypothetical protein
MTTTSDKRYDSELAALLVANYGEALRTAARLSTSLERTEDLFPLTGDALARLDDGGAERLDAFRVRFSDLQDLVARRIRLAMALEALIGERRVDLVVRPRSRAPAPIHRIARRDGIPLHESRAGA